MNFGDDLENIGDDLGDVCQVGAVTFRAKFNPTSREVFDAVTAGDYTLRYRRSLITLEREDSVTIAGVEYIVAAPPEQINAHEMTAQLVKA